MSLYLDLQKKIQESEAEEAVEILQGSLTSENQNKHGIKFMDFPEGAANAGFKDPWGSTYVIRMGKDVTQKEWKYQTRVFFRSARGCEHE